MLTVPEMLCGLVEGKPQTLPWMNRQSHSNPGRGQAACWASERPHPGWEVPHGSVDVGSLGPGDGPLL